MSNASDVKLLDLVKKNFDRYSKKRTEFLRKNTKECSVLDGLLSESYKLASKQDEENVKSLEVLEELVLEEMDDEQVFQQLVLRNNLKQPQLIEKAAKLLAMPEQKLLINYKEEANENLNDEDEEPEDDYDEELADDYEDDELDDDYEEQKEEMQVIKHKQQRKKVRPSVVDDKFFKLDEMREFLEAEDAKEMRKHKKKTTSRHEEEQEDDDEIDYFAEDLGGDLDEEEEDSDENNPAYADFFDQDDDDEDVEKEELSKKTKQQNEKSRKIKDFFEQNEEAEDSSENEVSDEEKVEQAEEEDDEENEEEEVESEDNKNNEETADVNEPRLLEPASDSDDAADEVEKPVSSHEQRQERLNARIQEYEQIVLGEKPWQLKGEIQAESRPKNSLLEEILDFEAGTRPAPVITEQTTRSLEEIIKQRIMDQAWDDVELKVRPLHTPQEYRKQLVLDQEKSKESLAQIYEKEYQREMEKLDPNHNPDAAGQEELPLHKEIRREMQDLFNKLDALSNFHFRPRPVMPEAKIITNTPAVAMEEVAPTAVSNANLLAPQEVYRGPKFGLIGKSERTRTDKNRERRKKKQKQRAVHNALEARDVQRQKMGIPLTKKEESAKLLKKITKHRNVEKVNATDDKSALKSSKAFFNKLQDTTNATARNSIGKSTQKRKTDDTRHSAKKLKL